MAELIKVVRCKDCIHRGSYEYNSHGYPKVRPMCELDTGDPYELGRNAEDDEWFCADGEERD